MLSPSLNRNRVRALVATAAMAFMAVAVPLRACCDDFWSCVGAVATGGLSCVVEDLINSVKAMVQNVEHLVSTLAQQAADVVNLAKSELNGAANDLRNLAAQAESDFNHAASMAQSLVDHERMPGAMVAKNLPGGLGMATPAPGAAARPGMAVAPGKGGATKAPGTPMTPQGMAMATTVGEMPVDPKDVLAALNRAKAAIDGLRPDVAGPLNSVRQFATTAEQQALAAASSAGNIAQSVLLSPLRTLGGMLTDLINHPQNIFDPSRIVDDAITSVTNQVIDTMNQVHDAVMTQAKGTLDMARQPMQDLLDRSAAAKKMADAMDKLQKRRNKAALDALDGLIPRAPLPASQLAVHVAGYTHPSGITALDRTMLQKGMLAPYNRLAASKLTARTMGTQLGARIKKPWQDFKRMQASTGKPVPEAKPKVDAEIERRFAGRTPQQAEAEKRAMLAEARTRFGNDPKTLQKVVELIEGHPRIRAFVGGPGPMPARVNQ
ncbi:hypothetical protein GETHLI_24520 [Geothrix limicola]|uniref:Uncharacterized protein n=1 Tax=Geothrix limicola TaxID=2927978 RepID=A0ABQ5QHV0_9BACT|nr:hypothetical protein [Geothrix limicola]GLH73950.1 hypothetical protein GETHLI_24520 [Geothrix limicola]